MARGRCQHLQAAVWGAPLTEKWDEAPLRAFCGLLIPSRIGRMLKQQNLRAEVHRRVVHKLQPQRGHTFVVVSLPKDLVPAVLGHDWYVTFRLGTIYLRSRSMKGLYREVPPKKAGTSSTPVDVSTKSFISSGTIGEGRGPSLTPVPENAANISAAANSMDECALGMGDICLSEDKDEGLLSADGCVPLAQ